MFLLMLRNLERHKVFNNIHFLICVHIKVKGIVKIYARLIWFKAAIMDTNLNFSECSMMPGLNLDIEFEYLNET